MGKQHYPWEKPWSKEWLITPACSCCGTPLSYDLRQDEFKVNQAFWESWRCADCNDGVPVTLLGPHLTDRLSAQA